MIGLSAMKPSPPPDSSSASLRLRPYAKETPLQRSRPLSALAGADVWLKLENLQETGSFKFRGAANKLLSLTKEEAARGVVTASNGNHALGVATMGKRLGIAAEVFVSNVIDPLRKKQIEACGAKVNQSPGDSLVAEKTARRLAQESGRVYVSPYNDIDVVSGQGTIAVEILRKLPRLDAIFVATGCGGLTGGIGAHLRSASPNTRVIACYPENAPALYECVRAGRVIDVPEKPTLSSSTAGGVEEGSITLPLAQRVIDSHVLVSEDEILAAVRQFYRDERQIIEGAAGVAIAGFVKMAGEFAGQTVAIVICGGNVAPSVEKLIKS